MAVWFAAPAAWAAPPGADDAAAVAYADGWSSGDNGGNGFGPWTLVAEPGAGFAGFFTAATNGNTTLNYIQTGTNGVAWGLYANGAGANVAAGFRAFAAGPLWAGESFIISLENRYIASGGTLGFTLRSGNATNSATDYTGGARFHWGFVGGSNNYFIVDGSSGGAQFDTGVPWTENGLRLRFTLKSADTYDLEVVRLGPGGTTNTFSGRILAGSDPIASFAVYAADVDFGGADGNVYFNSIARSPKPVFDYRLIDDFNRMDSSSLGTPWMEFEAGDETVEPPYPPLVWQFHISNGVLRAESQGSTKHEPSSATINLYPLHTNFCLGKSHAGWSFHFDLNRRPTGWGSADWGLGWVLTANTPDISTSWVDGYAVIWTGTGNELVLIRFNTGLGGTDPGTKIIGTGVDWDNISTNGMNVRVEVTPEGLWTLHYEEGDPLAAPEEIDAHVASGSDTNLFGENNGQVYTGVILAHNTSDIPSSSGDFDNFFFGMRNLDEGSVIYCDSADFTLDTTGFDPGASGVAYADSADFTLDTTGFDAGVGGVAYSDSADFTLDTTGFDAGVGGVAYADSADFTLDTTGFDPGAGGVAYADSADFTLDTTGFDAGVGGVAYADSADFTLDTTGFDAGVGGVAYADSSDFTLDTTGFDPGIGGMGYADSPDFILDTTGNLTPFEQWQIQYFGSSGNPAAAPDMDLFHTGFDNWFKYVAGLHPLEPNAVFELRIAIVPGEPHQKNLIFGPRWEDRTYTPMCHTNLDDGATWTNLPHTYTNDNGTERTVTDLEASETGKYYRILISFP